MEMTREERVEHADLQDLIEACVMDPSMAMCIARDIMPECEDVFDDRWALWCEANMRQVAIQCRARWRSPRAGWAGA